MKLWHETAGSGRSILFIHAGICDSRMWDAQWERFSDAYHLVRCDLRGFGRTGLKPGTFSHARDLLALLDDLDIERTVVVAVSMGGFVALDLAVGAPDRIAALVLGSPAIPGYEWSREMDAFGDAEDEALASGDIERAIQLNLKMWLDRPGRPPGSVDPNVLERVREMQRRAFELQVPLINKADDELLVPDLSERLGEIAAPTMVVVGEDDAADFHGIASVLAERITGLKSHTVSGAAHLAPMETPIQFNELLADFLTRLP